MYAVIRKEKLHNPIKQKYGHIQVLKHVLCDFLDINLISIVTFTTKADLKVKTKSDVTYTVRIPRTIKKYSIKSIDDSTKEYIYRKLLLLNIDSKENREAHVQGIKNELNRNA
ncbi:hypothetical protein [Clostridium thermarum]|uniref:hypothetical protein n=1 Tax=Clostridium thermarum TaxID=1716543 RepID=UPI0013D1CA22|nr:hypothetical protein [Clostridium thermarum]